MGKWRVAAILVGLLCAAAAGVRGVSSGVLGGIFFPRHDETRRAIGDTLDRLETAGRPIYILSESVAVDRSGERSAACVSLCARHDTPARRCCHRRGSSSG